MPINLRIVRGHLSGRAPEINQDADDNDGRDERDPPGAATEPSPLVVLGWLIFRGLLHLRIHLLRTSEKRHHRLFRCSHGACERGLGKVVRIQRVDVTLRRDGDRLLRLRDLDIAGHARRKPVARLLQLLTRERHVCLGGFGCWPAARRSSIAVRTSYSTRPRASSSSACRRLSSASVSMQLRGRFAGVEDRNADVCGHAKRGVGVSERPTKDAIVGVEVESRDVVAFRGPARGFRSREPFAPPGNPHATHRAVFNAPSSVTSASGAYGMRSVNVNGWPTGRPIARASCSFDFSNSFSTRNRSPTLILELHLRAKHVDARDETNLFAMWLGAQRVRGVLLCAGGFYTARTGHGLEVRLTASQRHRSRAVLRRAPARARWPTPRGLRSRRGDREGAAKRTRAS